MEWFIALVASGSLLITWRSTRIAPGSHRNADKCGRCGYSLDGLDVVVKCPECGHQDARLRHELARVERDYGVRPDRLGAYLVVAGCLLLTGWLRHGVLGAAFRAAMLEWYEPPGIIPMSTLAVTVGRSWVGWGLMIAGVIVWMAGERREWLIVRSVVVGLLLVVIGVTDAWLSPPTRLPGVGHLVLLGCVVLCVLGWYVVRGAREKTKRKRTEVERFFSGN